MRRLSAKRKKKIKKNHFWTQSSSSTNTELIGFALLWSLGQNIYLHKYLHYILSDPHV